MLVRGFFVVALACAAACGQRVVDGGDSYHGDNDTVLGGDVGDGGQVINGDSEPINSVPASPIAFTAGEEMELASPKSSYFIVVPRAYDVTHQTPIQLFIYLHGCGGVSSDDAWAAGTADTEWMGMAPGGAEGICWEDLGVNEDQSVAADIVMAALADLKTHFNIDPKRVHIGGYSSGGDLSYYTAFRHAGSFAGVLSYNSIPAYNTSEIAGLVAGAAWKMNIVHLAHTQDYVYPIAGVHTEFTALQNAGFPVTFIERPGLHYDDNTTDDRNTLVYPHLSDGWRAP